VGANDPVDVLRMSADTELLDILYRLLVISMGLCPMGK
jgi:hypothetical protein